MERGLARLKGDVAVERVRELFEYDPDTGVLRNKIARGSRGLAGADAGCPQGASGYLCAQVDRKKYAVHRLVWVMVYGRWPSLYLDHINCDITDNRIENLREADGTQNCANRRACGRSGIKGATLTRCGGWQAVIRKHGVQRYLGTFATAELANAAYKKAALELFGEFARAS